MALDSFERFQQAERARREAEAAEKAFEQKRKEQAELLWRIATNPKDKLAKQGKSFQEQADHILGFQLETVAITALINLAIGTGNLLTMKPFVTDWIEYQITRKTLVPFDARIHKRALPAAELAPLEASGAKPLNGMTSTNGYVPLNYDHRYHKLFQGREEVDVPENETPNPSLIKANGYMPEPTLLSSLEEDVKVTLSKLINMSQQHSNQGDEMALLAANRPRTT